MLEILHSESTVFMKSLHLKCLLRRRASSSSVATCSVKTHTFVFLKGRLDVESSSSLGFVTPGEVKRKTSELEFI